jgi:hypothetical protein
MAMSNGRYYQFESSRGELAFIEVPYAKYTGPLKWNVWTHSASDKNTFVYGATILGFRLSFGENNCSKIPYWFVLLVTAGIGSVPWIRWSFSLRTMLIAVTLIAALLGLARLATFSN